MSSPASPPTPPNPRLYSVRPNGLRGDPIICVILVGDAGVGKSSIFFQYSQETSLSDYIPTIGVDFRYKQLWLDDQQPVKLQIWDTAGHERYRCITSSYYRSADAILLVYDITNRQSFLALQGWVATIREMTARSPVFVVVGNKSDRAKERMVTKEEAALYAADLDASYMEVTTRNPDGIAEVFECLAREVVESRIVAEAAKAAITEKKETQTRPEQPTIRLIPSKTEPKPRSFFSGYC